jgi:serine phosphatase RsbU (regulator of sigma subunit)/anti-sigma regulatory factor (Ser/Thr protein kinase)
MYTTVLFLVLFALMYAVISRLLRGVVVEPITRTNEVLKRITEGDLYERVNVHNVKEFTALSKGINMTVDALKDSIEEAEQRNAQELATAKAIQESALPSEFPPFPDIDRFDIFASMKTAKEVGGDFYDFFLIEEGKIGFLMADVSGKGIPAALFMMSAKTEIRLYMEAGFALDKAIASANHQLCLGNERGMFVTLFACVLDYRTGELAYVNAGHNPPAIRHAGAWEWMREVSGMPLGLFDGLPYEAFSRQLDVGDLLFLYTDGVTEAMNVGNELFGEDRLERSLHAYEDMNTRSLLAGVGCAVSDFVQGADQSDDITMLALKYGVPPERRAMIVIPAEDTQLENLTGIVHEELARHHAPKSVYNPIDIALEELFVNVCRYAYPEATPDNPGEARIAFSYEPSPSSLTIQIIDDGIPYNPLERPDPVLPDNVMDMQIGGLGIMLSKQCVDEIHYEHDGKSNILTFTKCW